MKEVKIISSIKDLNTACFHDFTISSLPRIGEFILVKEAYLLLFSGQGICPFFRVESILHFSDRVLIILTPAEIEIIVYLGEFFNLTSASNN